MKHPHWYWLLAAVLLAAGLAWAVWQYRLCRAEIGASVWYCIQHAGG